MIIHFTKYTSFLIFSKFYFVWIINSIEKDYSGKEYTLSGNWLEGKLYTNDKTGKIYSEVNDEHKWIIIMLLLISYYTSLNYTTVFIHI